VNEIASARKIFGNKFEEQEETTKTSLDGQKKRPLRSAKGRSAWNTFLREPLLDEFKLPLLNEK